MASSARQLLALGTFNSDQRLVLAEAAEQATFDPVFVDSGREATRWLGANTPAAVVLDDAPLSRSLCLEARAEARHSQIPMISLNRELDDLVFAEVFSWGGDDALEMGDVQALSLRLRLLPDSPGDPVGGRGTALIVDGDRPRRIAAGRILRNAGYAVEFAASDDDALASVRERAPRVVIATLDEGSEVPRLLREARREGSSATFVIACPPRDLGAARGAVEPFGNATVTDGFAPPENIVFLLNEMERGGASDKRASRRLLYGTTVSFRGAGRDVDEHGYSYNVSLGGLYVRTLAPPDDDLVWLEMQPPRSERRVRVEGRVVWRRRFGTTCAATVPPGFGVALTDGSRRDMEAWKEGYGAFSEALGLSA